MKWHRHHFGSKRKSIFNTYQKQRNINCFILLDQVHDMIYYFYFHFLVAILGGNKLDSQSFWYWDLQWVTKLVKTLCPKGPFWPLPEAFPTPPLPCNIVLWFVLPLGNKQLPSFEWRGVEQRGVNCFVLRSYSDHLRNMS